MHSHNLFTNNLMSSSETFKVLLKEINGLKFILDLEANVVNSILREGCNCL